MIYSLARSRSTPMKSVHPSAILRALHASLVLLLLAGCGGGGGSPGDGNEQIAVVPNRPGSNVPTLSSQSSDTGQR
jgi:hypothetical protein